LKHVFTELTGKIGIVFLYIDPLKQGLKPCERIS